MSQPNELLVHERRLVEYILGLLPEEEADRLDEASIVDDEIASRLSTIENDLVDAYAMGALDQEIRTHFEANYLKSPRRREKVKFARRFLGAVDRAAIRPVPATPAVATIVPSASAERVRPFAPRLKPKKRVVKATRFSWPMLTAAASLAVACVVLVNDFQLRHGLSLERQRNATGDRQNQMLTEQLAEARTETFQIEQALRDAQRGSAAVDLPGTSSPSSHSSAGSLSNNATILSPQTRSIAPTSTVEFKNGTIGLAFDLLLETNDFRQYRATLREAETARILWRSVLLAPHRKAADVVSLVVPSSVLESLHYSIELAGVDSGGRETAVSSYAVQIVRQ